MFHIGGSRNKENAVRFLVFGKNRYRSGSNQGRIHKEADLSEDNKGQRYPYQPHDLKHYFNFSKGGAKSGNVKSRYNTDESNSKNRLPLFKKPIIPLELQ
jgi:hypothetical protein